MRKEIKVDSNTENQTCDCHQGRAIIASSTELFCILVSILLINTKAGKIYGIKTLQSNVKAFTATAPGSKPHATYVSSWYAL